MSRTVNVHEAKSTLSKLLADVEAGETIVIARAGKPVAELAPLRPRSGVKFGLAAGKIIYDSDTFDDVDPEVVAMFEGSKIFEDGDV